MNSILFTILLIIGLQIHAQDISGYVMNEKDSTAIGFVNIGIAGKNIGTVSTAKGFFVLPISPEFESDTLLFSCIGFNTKAVKVSDLLGKNISNIHLEEKITELQEVVVVPRKYVTRLLGITADAKLVSAGFKDNELGSEMGVFMKNKKTAHIKQVNFNIAHCTYDTIFYRLNIYKHVKDKEFENILTTPVYVELLNEQVENTVSIDLRHLNLYVEGNFLVTLEHIKDLGEGNLYFCAALLRNTYFRKTSHGEWTTVPAGVSINVLADIER